jgi:hypothetical protein
MRRRTAVEKKSFMVILEIYVKRRECIAVFQ